MVGEQKQRQSLHSTFTRGFALPTVLISSIVLMIVLTVSVSATTAVRQNLLNQYYDQLAQVAGEAGVAYAKACLAANNNVPTWSNSKPLTQTTDCFGNEQNTTSANVLVVGGGGGGGGTISGGGGGGGVVQQAYSLSVASYPVTVGNGGGGGLGWDNVPNNGSNGGNSVFGTMTAIGGGGGAGYNHSAASSGGSGGGGSYMFQTGGTGTSGQGNSGGNETTNNANVSGGGGGAGAAGGVSTATQSGNGGNGIVSSVSGAAVYYGGGGGGGARSGSGSAGVGGLGGGGTGTTTTTTAGAGQANTGGGGGGGGYSGASTAVIGGGGGTGVVIISYPNNGTITATGGTISYANGYKIHTFTSSGTFQVTAVNPATCPNDPRCALVSNGDVLSGFSVGMPTVDSNGKAVTIPENGYVNLIRTSTGAIWKTIKQPSAQAAVVPDQCSGAATSDQGWNNAVPISYGSYNSILGATNISISSSSNVIAGPIFYRKDFNIPQSGTYLVKSRVDDSANIYIDGSFIGSSAVSENNTVKTFSVTLAAGCHTINVNSINANVTGGPTNMALSIAPTSSGSPVVVSDTTWRVTAGNTIPFNAPGFYADPTSWTPVRDMQPSYTINSAWQTTTADSWAMTEWLSPAFGYDGSGNYPANQSILYKDDRVINVSSPTDIKVAYDCDDSCTVLLDGNPIGNGVWNSVQITSLTLSEGSHSFGIVSNNGSGGMGVMMAAWRTSDNTMLTRTEANSWRTTNTYFSSNPSLVSYDANYIPTPRPTKGIATGSLLVVGGGGGGGSNSAGGGGAGGLVRNDSYQFSIGTTNVTIGAGGAGSPNTSSVGGTGGSSAFGSVIALGGGGGTSRDTSALATSGASGGGGAGAAYGNNAAAAGIAGQGSNGGAGTPNDAGCSAMGGGGGGIGGVGWAGVSGGAAGRGGPGMINWITGVPIIYSGGGGGSNTCGTGSVGVADKTVGYNGAAGVANTGAGGSSGPGAAGGGAGTSGVVIISFPTGSMTTSATGTYTTTTAFGNTIYKFTGNGTFTVSAINI